MANHAFICPKRPVSVNRIVRDNSSITTYFRSTIDYIPSHSRSVRSVTGPPVLQAVKEVLLEQSPLSRAMAYSPMLPAARRLRLGLLCPYGHRLLLPEGVCLALVPLQ